MNVTYFVLQFIIAGIVVVGASLLSSYLDSKWAGLLVALPTMTLLGLIFISFNSTDIITKRYLLSSIIFMIPAAIYLISLYLLFGKVSLGLNLLISLIPLGISVFIIQSLF
ncbi:MAG: hypothetical protein ACMXX7_01085 [Candidatus Woesearchaeota archaeon]